MGPWGCSIYHTKAQEFFFLSKYEQHCDEVTIHKVCPEGVNSYRFIPWGAQMYSAKLMAVTIWYVLCTVSIFGPRAYERSGAVKISAPHSWSYGGRTQKNTCSHSPLTPEIKHYWLSTFLQPLDSTQYVCSVYSMKTSKKVKAKLLEIMNPHSKWIIESMDKQLQLQYTLWKLTLRRINTNQSKQVNSVKCY